MRFIPKKKENLIETEVNPLDNNLPELTNDEKYTQAITKAIASESGAIVEYEQIIALEKELKSKELVNLFHDTLEDIKDEEIKHLAQLNEKLSQVPSLKNSYEAGKEEAKTGKDKEKQEESVQQLNEFNYMGGSTAYWVTLDKVVNGEWNILEDETVMNLKDAKKLANEYISQHMNDSDFYIACVEKGKIYWGTGADDFNSNHITYGITNKDQKTSEEILGKDLYDFDDLIFTDSVVNEAVDNNRMYDAEVITKIILNEFGRDYDDPEFDKINQTLDPMNKNILTGDEVDEGMLKLAKAYEFTDDEILSLEQKINYSKDPNVAKAEDNENDMKSDIERLEDVFVTLYSQEVRDKLQQLIDELKMPKGETVNG